MDLILKYFPELTSLQKKHFEKLIQLYPVWNEKINVISRKDIQHLEERHILHSLAIARYIQFKARTTVLDLGTGGGFPGIPLAVLFPDTQFMLVDSIAKKIKVVNEISDVLGLKNISSRHARAEELKERFDFVVCRAVAPINKIDNWTKDKIRKKDFNDLPNGLICLKGGDIEEELKSIRKRTRIVPVSNWFTEAFFSTKMIVYLKKRLILHSH